MINFCEVKVFMVLLETDTTWMEKFLEFMKWGKYIPNKQGLILSLKTNTAFCFLWVTWLFISGDMNQVLDNMTWGEMTSGWLEQLLGVL